jgi:hypothetical protein
MNNIYVLNKSYRQIGVLSNQGANPQAPYYDDLYIQELDTGADTFQFSAVSNKYTQDLLEIGNHIMFSYKNRNELFTITSLEYSHYEGYKTIGVYAEGIGFELLDVFMERPELPEEDEDEEGNKKYPNNIYIDENGNIIYDPEGNYEEDEDKITIDENGNIIYNPSTNKKKNNDSLEFKNISYPRFLSMLLKNTGWSYVCQPGLESVKHDISVRYDTNIYAILQDSMQAYRGVELEFVYEMHGGKVQKVVKAYKDGGRGSFVGKRFEYGKNVRGITKTQEVTNSEDDTVLYVDNIGVEVYYDVDFALKSAEVSEIEIGDTHYVIDREFCPPMTIKARIGKIEISFSDPTKNKISLANNKKIRGSAIEEDNIKDIIDDYDGIDDGGDDYVGDHTHDRLVYDYNEVIFDGKSLYPDTDLGASLGYSSLSWDAATIRRVYAKNTESCTYKLPFDREDMINVSKISNTGDSVTKQDLYDFIVNKLNIYTYVSMDELGIQDDFDNSNYGTHLGILSEDFYNHKSDNDSDCTLLSKVVNQICWQIIPDTDGDGSISDETTHIGHTYDLPSLVCALIGAFQQYVTNGGGPIGTDSIKFSNGVIIEPSAENGINIEREDGDGTKTSIFGELYVTEGVKCELTMEANTLDVNTIQFSDGTTLTSANGLNGGGSNPDSGDNGNVDLSDYATIQYVDDAIAGIEAPDLSDYATKTYVDNAIEGLGDSSSGIGDTLDTLTVRKIQGPPPEQEGFYNCVEFEDAISVDHIWCNNDTGVIEFGSDTYVSMHNNLTVHGDADIEMDLLVGGTIKATEIEFMDGTKMTTASNTLGTYYVDRIYSRRDPGAEPSVPDGQISFEEYGKYLTLNAGHQIRSYCNKFSISGDLQVHSISGGGGAVPLKYIKVDSDIKMPNYYIECKELTQSSDKSLKENIRYIDEPVKRTDDLLDKADLHDFIVNQVSICEYNFIGDTSDKIGFIANDYEGTKVGDKIVSRNGENDTFTYSPDNLLFATIGALQEEVRMRDEQIASLEARLAAIEEMLNNK